MTPLPLFSGPMLFIIGAFVCALAIFLGTLYAANPGKMRERKAIILLTAIIAGVFILYVAFYITVGIIGGYRIDRALAELKRDGAKLTLAEIIPPKVTGNENAEAYYREAFAAMEASENVDTIKKQHENASSALCSYAEWSAKDWLSMRAALAGDDTRHILDLLKQGAARQKLRFTRDYDKKPLWNFPLPELCYIHCSSRLLSVSAVVAAMDGKQDLAYDRLRIGLTMSEQMKNEPFLMSRLVQISMVKTNVDCLVQVARQYGISTPRAEMFIRCLRKLDIGAAVDRSIDAELITAKQVFDSFSAGEREDSPVIFHFGNESLSRGIYCIWPFTRMDFVRYLQLVLRAKVLLREPYWKVKSIAQYKYDFSAIHPITRSLHPFYCSLGMHVARINSEIENAVQTLALEIYKNKHGSYPERLEQLVPEVLPTLPLDPYTGKPFHYEKRDVAYALTCGFFEEQRAHRCRR